MCIRDSSRTTWPISTKLGTKHPWVKGTQVCSNEGPRAFPRGNNFGIAKNTLTKLKNLLLQNHWANFNQTWHKASKWQARPFTRGDNYEIAKYIDEIKKNLLQNHWTNFNQTFSKSIFWWWGLKFVQMKASPSSKGR